MQMEKENTDVRFMRLALEEARAALEAGDFPVGCVIADGERAVASGFRTTSRGSVANEIDHAEIIALTHLYKTRPEAPKDGLSLYSTLEPCLMCFGATLLAGIRRIVFAFEDVMGGGTACNRELLPPLYRDVELAIIPNVCRDESLALMGAFFSNPRNRYLRNTLFEAYAMEKHAAAVTPSSP